MRFEFTRGVFSNAIAFSVIAEDDEDVQTIQHYIGAAASALHFPLLIGEPITVPRSPENDA